MACLEQFATICVIRGSGTAGTVTLTSNGTPVNINGYSAVLVAKKRLSDTDANAVYNKALTIQDEESGVFAYSITAAESATFEAPIRYYAEITFTPKTGEIFKIQGLIAVTEEVYDGN
jgi:hypothetical protein